MAFGAFGKDFAITIVYMYLMFYYTDVVGISAATVEHLSRRARIWDAVNDNHRLVGQQYAHPLGQNSNLGFLIGARQRSVVLLMVFSAHYIEVAWLIAYAAITCPYFCGAWLTLMDILFGR